MKITPKLLIGQMITEDKNMKDVDKIKMLIEIVHLNEEELDSWIEKSILDGRLSELKEGKSEAIGKVISKYGREALKKTKKFMTPSKWYQRNKIWEKPIKKPLRTIAKVGVVGIAGASVYNAIAKRLNSCKVSCKEQYKVSKDRNQFAKCMTYCQHVANAATTKAKEAGK